MNSPTVELARELIRRPSVTPEDKGCQDIFAKRLGGLGFVVERLAFEEVDNLWARLGSAEPLFVFAGHTDVVPTGPVEAWKYEPFAAHIEDGYLHGRGAADMKGSLAAMLTAVEAFLKDHKDFKGSLGFLITSDEEGPSINGTKRVMKWLEENKIAIDYCLVGEPSSVDHMGDTIKNGRRGSLGGVLTAKGIQGHVAYPHRARNPIHDLAPALAKLVGEAWDQGNDFFPATSFQVSNINAGTGANNVIPGSCEVVFNFRYSTEVSQEQLRERVHQVLDEFDLDYDIAWQHNGPPFLTSRGPLIEAIVKVTKEHTKQAAELSTSGGTSDGRFIAPTGTHVVEFGPVNRTIHKVDECVRVEDLDVLHEVYQSLLVELFRDRV